RDSGQPGANLRQTTLIAHGSDLVQGRFNRNIAQSKSAATRRSGTCRLRGHDPPYAGIEPPFRRNRSVVVRAAHVVAALLAHQLAAVAGEPMAASGANLTMVFERRVVGSAARTTL